MPTHDGTDEAVTPQVLTDRLSALDVGDTFTVNDRETEYEVVDTATYSVTAEDEDGNRLTVSQNLQTGGWILTESVYVVD